MKTCMDCPHHKVIPDPDPHDSFCMDDMAVVCMLTINPKINYNSKYRADSSPNRKITTSCRPYNLRKETETPTWCPLKLTHTETTLIRNDRK